MSLYADISVAPSKHRTEKDNNLIVFNTFNSEIYAEAQPIKAFTDDFDKQLTHGDSAFTYNQFEVGVSYKEFKFGMQSRYDYALEFDPDTALYTHIDKNKLQFEQRDYRYYLKAKNATTHGVFISYGYQLDEYNLIIIPKISFLSGKHYQDGKVEGTIFAGESQGKLNVDYYFSKDRLFKSFESNNALTSKGLSLDLDLHWNYSRDIKMGLSIKDLYYRNKFKNSPFVTGFTNDIPFKENEDGNITTQPSVVLNTSENGNDKDHTLVMPMRVYSYLDYRIDNHFSTQISIKKLNDDIFTQAKARWHFFSNWALVGGYEIKSTSWLMAIESKNMGFSFQTDSLDLNKAYYASINWYFNIHF
jgi:hypothetical protein